MRVNARHEMELKGQVKTLQAQLIAARAERDAAETIAADPTPTEDLKAVVAKVRSALASKVQVKKLFIYSCNVHEFLLGRGGWGT